MDPCDGSALLAQWTWWQFVQHNWALLSIIATLAALVAIPSVVLGRYIRIMLNIMKDTPPPLSMGPLDFERIEGQEVRFRSFDGTSLRGMFVMGNGRVPRKGMILFLHEYASDMYSCARYCRPLLEAGYDVFTFDFRGHGQSSCDEHYQPRQWVSDHEVDDVLGACAFVEDYLESQGLPIRMGVLGISRGACAGIIGCAHIPAVKAIVTDGLFSTDMTLETLMKRWAGIFAKVRFVYENHPPAFWRFLRWLLFCFTGRAFNCKFPSVRKMLRHFHPRPVLMIHGEKDSYISADQARYLYSLLPQPKQLWIVSGAKHNQAVIVAAEQYARRTVEFFDKYLAVSDSQARHTGWQSSQSVNQDQEQEKVNQKVKWD